MSPQIPNNVDLMSLVGFYNPLGFMTPMPTSMPRPMDLGGGQFTPASTPMPLPLGEFGGINPLPTPMPLPPGGFGGINPLPTPMPLPPGGFGGFTPMATPMPLSPGVIPPGLPSLEPPITFNIQQTQPILPTDQSGNFSFTPETTSLPAMSAPNAMNYQVNMRHWLNRAFQTDEE